MSTKAQRERVINALDCLASQEDEHYQIDDVLEVEDRPLACRAWAHHRAMGIDTTAWMSSDEDWWRYHMAEAAQLLREGTVK